MTIQINRVVAASLLGSLGILVCVAGQATQARPLSDRTLALVLGSNGPQTGTKSYDCADAAVTANPNSNYITAANCGSTANGSVPAKQPTCVSCNGPSASSFGADQNGASLTYQRRSVDCSKSPTTGQATQLSSQGPCQPSQTLATAVCGTAPPAPANNLGVCPAGNFAVFTKQ